MASCIVAYTMVWLSLSLEAYGDQGETASITLNTETTTPQVPPLKASIYKETPYPINLANVLRLVERQNLYIAMEEASVGILSSRLHQRQATLLPSIDGSLTQSRLEGGQQVFGDVVTVIRKTVQPQVGVNWTLYPGGRTVFEILAAKQRKNAAQSLLKATLQDQLALATQEYYQLLSSYQSLQVAQKTLNEAAAQVRYQEALLDTGKGIPLDLSRAKTQYAQQVSGKVQADVALTKAEQTLLNRLNLDPSVHLIPEDTTISAHPLLSPHQDLPQLMAEAKANHPVLKSLDSDIKAIVHDLHTVLSDILPSVTVRAYLNGTGPAWSELTKTEFGGITVNTNLLENLGVQIPFRAQEKKRLLQQKQLEREQKLRDIETEIMTAYLNIEAYEQAMEATAVAQASALESYNLAVGRYEAGYGIHLDVLNAQTVLATAQKDHIQAVAQFNQAQVDLIKALGDVTPKRLLNEFSEEPAHP